MLHRRRAYDRLRRRCRPGSRLLAAVTLLWVLGDGDGEEVSFFPLQFA